MSQSHIMTQQPIFSVDIVRSVTRLKSLFINFYADATTGDQTNGVNIKAGVDLMGNGNMDFALRPFNRFYNPQSL